jgi:hypothetical protein
VYVSDVAIRIKDHRGGDNRPGQASASDFVDAGDAMEPVTP